MRDKVPQEFYRGDRHPRVKTVGQLISQLSRLPKNLRLSHDEFAEKQLVVYNIDQSNVHLDIEDTD